MEIIEVEDLVYVQFVVDLTGRAEISTCQSYYACSFGFYK
jgi:hypothetical protein